VTELTTPPAAVSRAAGAAARTIPQLWQQAISAGRGHPAYLVERNGRWDEVSWREAGTAVDEFASGLLALGVGKGDAFAILGRNALEWTLFDFALAAVGAISTPIYASSAPRDCLYILEHSESVGVLIEDESFRPKVEGFAGRVLAYGDLDDLRARGREHAAAHPGALAEATAAIHEDDLFTYIYTSGTTGPPKGCMIRHRNHHAMATKSDAYPESATEGDTMLLYLPLAHTFGRTMQLSGAHRGYTIAFLADPLRAAEVLPRIRPTVLPTVPRLFEKVHTIVLSHLSELTGLKRTIADWSLGVGRAWSERVQRGEPVPPWLALRQRIADRLVFAKIRRQAGFDRLRYSNSGGAPLSGEIAAFFHALGILIVEGYGLSECTTAATVNHQSSFKFGTVGQAMPGVELQIADDGEILVRSDTVFAGYLKDSEATAAALDADGWLHTGDVGELDDEGFLTITDRKKDILVTAGGKNVAPQNLENDLKMSRFVSQAIVLGDRRPYVAALVTLDEAEVRRELELDGSLPENPLHGDPRVRALLQTAVDDVNRDRSRYEQIKRFAILPRDFTIETDELTPTLKLKRRAVQENFAAEIDALYAG
jgi:long-chain acyl-CoA synthetase